MGFVRMVVLGPLLHIKNGNLPRGVRKVETQLLAEDFAALRNTIPVYNRESLLESLANAVELYRSLRAELYPTTIQMQAATELKAMEYFEKIK